MTFLGDKLGLVETVKQLGVSEDASKLCLTDPKAFDILVKQSERASKEDGVSGTTAIRLNGATIDPANWQTVKSGPKPSNLESEGKGSGHVDTTYS